MIAIFNLISQVTAHHLIAVVDERVSGNYGQALELVLRRWSIPRFVSGKVMFTYFSLFGDLWQKIVLYVFRFAIPLLFLISKYPLYLCHNIQVYFQALYLLHIVKTDPTSHCEENMANCLWQFSCLTMKHPQDPFLDTASFSLLPPYALF